MPELFRILYGGGAEGATRKGLAKLIFGWAPFPGTGACPIHKVSIEEEKGVVLVQARAEPLYLELFELTAEDLGRMLALTLQNVLPMGVVASVQVEVEEMESLGYLEPSPQ